MKEELQEAVNSISEERIREHIQTLEGIRHPQTAPEALKEAEGYIRDQLASLGLEIEDHIFIEGGEEFTNIIATKRGSKYPEELVMVLAHYDTVEDSPGADDNASGVAGVLELARVLASVQTDRSLQFAAVNLEENRMGEGHSSITRGSGALAADAKEQGWKIEAVIDLEMIAFAGDNIPQNAPPGLPISLPEFGNFIAVIGNENSALLVEEFLRAIETHEIDLPLETLVVPGNGEMFEDVRRLDHAPFWDLGYRAVMVTDTANFRSPHYHQPSETLETLNIPFAANVCRAVAGVMLAKAELSP
jgi:hypothetical protein